MVNIKTFWSADGTHLPPIDPHTKAKHLVMEEYIKNWILTLCGNNMGNRKTVTLIDGFSGGGMYIDTENNKALWEGSPIRMIKMVEEGLRLVRSEKSKPDYQLNVKFIFIDSKRDHLDCLKLQIKEAGLESYINNPDKCEFFCNEFENVVERCIAEVNRRKGSSFFFLDPFGWTDVSMESIRKIINLGKSEILFTFMTDFIKRFLPKKEEILNKPLQILEATDYFCFADLDKIDSLNQQRYIRNESLRLFREQGNVKYVWTFALVPKIKYVLYYLVHLSSHPKALEVMKNTLWIYNNLEYQYHFDIYGLGYKTPDDYKNNPKIFNIVESNNKMCIKELIYQIQPVINSREDGITLDELNAMTMQKNPATINHYISSINELKGCSEVEVLKPDGNKFTGEKIHPKYIIRKSQNRLLFDLKPFIKS